MANQKTKNTADTRAKQMGRFGIVGILNTVIDFLVFNIMGKVFLFGPIPSNFVSTTCAMTFSFFANKHVVFQHKGTIDTKQAMKFIVVTGFGVWVLQSLTIKLLTEVWTAPMHLFVRVIRDLGIGHFKDVFYINNGAKLVATVVSLAWNYVMYKKVVFRRV
jgi:putative flippase GtrA